MASWIISLLSFFWPSRISDDISASHRLVHSLPLQPSTRYFTFALCDPQQPNSVLYILSSLPLSEQSAFDACDLISIVKPGAVVAHVGLDATEVIHMEHLHALTVKNLDMYPKSALHVLKESFHDGNNHAKYMKMAQADVTRAIFGTTFMGHAVAAKQAAGESKSLFYYLESPGGSPENADTEESLNNKKDSVGAAGHVASSLGNSWFSPSGSRDCRVNLNSPGLKFIASHVQSSLEATLADTHFSAGMPGHEQNDTNDTEMEYECPEFAQLFYPFLAELYNTYKHLPGMGLALERTQRLLMDVEKGKVVNHSELAICRCFRLAVEGLRVALNGSARAPLRLENMLQFDDLPYEEKCYVLLAQALKQQLQKSQSVVAVLDVGMVAGIRKYWTTPVPDHVAALATECLISEADEDASLEAEGSKGGILDKPIIVVGAGAAAALGVASFSQWAPASTAMKILSFKIPTFIKLGMLQTKKGAIASIAKAANPVMNWFVPSGKGILAAKSTVGSKVSVMKAVANTGNIRAVAHSVITTAKKTSLSAIRTAFYNAMRNRHRKGVGGKLWLSFGASVAACAGLLQFEEGIENVIEIIPQAYSISQLCQGLNNVCHASDTLNQVEDVKYWGAMYSRLYKEFKHPK